MICAECLKKIVASQASSRGGVRRMFRGLLPVTGLLLAWLCFYILGRTLLLIPAPIHDGTVWEQSK